MKTKNTLLAFALLISLSTFAQQGFNYKALIKDNLGNMVANQNITVQFSILEDVAIVYTETHTPTTDANGLVNLNIGEGTTSDDFSTINWGSDDHFLNVQINIGSGLTDMGTIQFMSVPYAKFAENSITEINNLTDAKTIDRSIYLGNGSGNADDGNDNQNTAIGNNALKYNTNGVQNVAVGESTLLSNISGERNTVIGQSAMRRNTTGSNNTVIGEDAMYNNLTGSGNVAIGQGAGNGELGDNKLYIDNSTTSSPLIWGDFTDGNEKVKINGKFEIETANSGTQPNLNLIHDGNTGARINFTNTDTTNGNVWTLYGDTNDTNINSSFNLYHSNTGNIITARGDGRVTVNGDLVVSNTTKIGSSGVAISEVIKLTGTTGGALGSGSNSIPYPTGYNWENTYVVSFKVRTTVGGLGGTSWYTSLGNYNSGDDQSIYIDLGYEPNPANTPYIKLKISDSQYNGAEYVLILMKIE
ncbi:hypothetical protein DI383_12010 [Flavobacteriaceae bacterium LYZ1037]|nr:hypothetical protein DI383_12010 [Flavobacteriaceae bacterium LYZ1037]